MSEAINFLKTICDEKDILVESFPFQGNAKGYCLSDIGGKNAIIGYNNKLPEWEAVLTIAHELAHCLLHFNDDLLNDGGLDSGSAIRAAREHQAETFGAAWTAMALYDYYKDKLVKM